MVSISVDPKSFQNQQGGNTNILLSSEIPMRTDVLSFNNKTVPSVDYSGDIFERQSENGNEQNLYTAKDGKKYNIKEVIKNRINNLFVVEQKKKGNIFNKFINYVKEKFNIAVTYKKYQPSLMESYKILDETKSISEAFFNLTGFEYNDDNVEKFLVGDIKLKSEILAERYTGKQINLSSTPYISKYYTSENLLNELQNTRKELNKKEIEEYNTIKNLLPKEYQQKLELILNNGQLLLDNSEGKVTVLSSLYKIITEDRAEKIDKVQLLKNCIDILDNPYVITQNGEDIPEEYQNEFSERLITGEIERREKLIAKGQELTNEEKINSNMFQAITTDRENVKKQVIDENKDDVFQFRHPSTCAAASVEFELAAKYPAEFFRIVEGLTSKNKNTTKNIKMTPYSKFQLTNFNAKHEIINDEQAMVTISADENAYLLAEIQNKYKDEHERSIIDIIMQSAIMNLGSRQTYNSIDDKREPNEYTSNDGGLVALEVSFVREILTGQTTCNNCYKSVDEEGFVKDLYTQENVKNEILRALQKNDTVVAGIIYTDENNRCAGGHEVTVVGYTTNLQGQGFFIIQDSDDGEQKPITMPEEELLRRIHHANL